MEKCIICLKPYTKSNPKTLEHIIPEFLGGNMAVEFVCKSCNSSMGADFEGRLSNNPLFKLPRHIHDIPGKAGIGKEVHPFSGTHKLNDGRILRVHKNGRFELISKIDFNRVDGISNEYSYTVEVDETNKDDLENIVYKKLERLSKKQGANYSKDKLTELTKKTIEESNKTESILENPEIHIDASFDIDDLRLLYIKIGYEIASHLFGESYIDDPVANILRTSLYNLNVHNSVIIRILEPENDITKNLFEDGYHWIFFMKNICYIRLYSMVGTLVFSKASNFITDDVYRFCYKTKKIKKIKLMDMVVNLAKEQKF